MIHRRNQFGQFRKDLRTKSGRRLINYKPVPVCPEHGVPMLVQTVRKPLNPLYPDERIRTYQCPIVGCAHKKQQTS